MQEEPTPTTRPSDGPVALPPIQSATPPPPPVKHRRTRKISAVIGLIIGGLLLLSAGVIGGAVAVKYFLPDALPSFTTTVDGNSTVTAEESSIAAVAEKVAPSVVSIVTETRTTRSSFGTGSGQAAGTGIIVSADGYILTNNHVLEGARSVSVIDSNGDLYEDVTIIGRDPLNDIAFLKIKSDKTFTPATLGNSATIRPGQQVVAIGNALGQYSNTVTSGIISGTGRPITASDGSGAAETLTDLIQTDASINPGNSGGPLVNLAGQVIGINTAIVEDANGIGFAIPINAAKGILAEVLETGKANRSYLGVSYLTITPEVAREYDLKVKDGAYVFTESDSNPVAAGSPAQKAGLKSGDIITKINNESVGAQGSLSSILGEYRPKDKVTITYLRDGKEQTTTAVLGSYKE